MLIHEALSYDDVLLVPKFSEVRSRRDIRLGTLFSTNVVLKIPVVSANMDTVTTGPMALALARVGGLGIIHRFLTIQEQVDEVKFVKKYGKDLQVGAAIGVKDYLKRSEKLIAAGVDVLVVDVAHGHAAHVLKIVTDLKKRWPKMDVVGGNVATQQGAEDFANAGADGVKVGIGPGATCSTRIVTGCGVPQLSALMDIAILKGSGDLEPRIRIPIIADGGIKSSGDITKALAAGASTVMLGSLLAGTYESPGLISNRNGIKYKIYRGMASFEANVTRTQKEGKALAVEDIIPEGVETAVPYKGPVDEVLNQLMGGLRSGMSYCGAFDIKQLQERAEFVKITTAGWNESIPHGLR